MAKSTPHTPTDSTTDPLNPSTPPQDTKPQNPSTPVARKNSGITIPSWPLYEQNPNHRVEVRGMTAAEVKSHIAETTVEFFFDMFLKPHNPENSSEEEAIQSIVDGLEVHELLKVSGGSEVKRYPHLIDLIQAAWKGTDFLARNVSLWGERKDFKITTDIVGYKRDPEAGGRDVTKHDIPQDQPPVSAQVDNLADTLRMADNIPEEENGSVAEGAPEQEDIASRVDDALARGAVPVGSVVDDASKRNRLDHLHQVFYRFAHMSDSDRGMDETVIEASAKDKRVLETFRAEHLPSLVKNHQCMFKQAFDLEGASEQGWPLVKIEVKKLDGTDSDSQPAEAPRSSENTGAESSTSSSPGEPSSKSIRLLVRYPRVSPRSPFGRSTKGFVALDVDEMKLKFLKDCWRYDNVKYHAEHEVYEKLRAAKVNNIAKVEGGGDVVDAEGEPQVTAAHWYLRRGKIKHLALVHYRLLIRQLGTPLKEYTWSNKLCYYLFLVILAHEGAFKAGILHRDISPNNIMIDEAPEAIGEEAFLIDWDLCRYLHELNNGPTQKKRSGTWAFISALLLKYPSKQHELSDDLESFIHVLHWFCLQFHVHNLRPSYQLSDTLSSVYFEARPQAGYDKGGDTKLRNMQKEKPFSK
ncbi:EKC/KEOPS complex subunit BUD32 [Abortiporus biennis]